MSQNTVTICDGCREECHHFIHIKEGMLRAANGKNLSVVLGHSDIEMKEKHFCSAECMVDWFYEKMPHERRGQFYFPGSQVGELAAGNKILGK